MIITLFAAVTSCKSGVITRTASSNSEETSSSIDTESQTSVTSKDGKVIATLAAGSFSDKITNGKISVSKLANSKSLAASEVDVLYGTKVSLTDNDGNSLPEGILIKNVSLAMQVDQDTWDTLTQEERSTLLLLIESEDGTIKKYFSVEVDPTSNSAPTIDIEIPSEIANHSGGVNIFLVSGSAPSGYEDLNDSDSDDGSISKPSGLALQLPSQSPGNSTTPSITVSGVTIGMTVTLYRDASCSTSASSGFVASSTSINITTSALSAGSYTFYAKQQDSEGNSSACSTASVSYTLDTTVPGQPTGLTLSSPASSPSTDPTPDIQVTGLEVGASLYIYSDSSCTNALTTEKIVTSSTDIITLSSLSDGTYTLYAMQIDSAGNESLCSTANVSYEFMDRQISLAVKSGSSSTISSDGASQTILQATVLDIAGDPVSGVSVALTIPTNGGTSSSPATTNASGIAEFTLTSSSVAGTYSYTVSIESGSIVSSSLNIGFSECTGAALTNSPFANWSGSDPGGTIVICTADQFNRIYDGTTYHSVTPAARLARDYRLGADIDLDGVTVNRIGSDVAQFTGDFDGNDYTISNFSFPSSADYAGLIAYMNGSAIADLTITTTGVSGATWVGVLAARSNGGTITNVHIRGATGDGSDTISATGGRIGGMVGQMDGSTTVISQSSVDDLTITAVSFWCGGMVGALVGAGAEKSYVGAGVSLSGSTETGGFVGVLSNSATSIVSDSYSHATVTSNGNGVGGFVGVMNTGSSVVNSYSTGDVCSGNCSGSNDGPFVGDNSGTVTNVFWNNQTSGWSSGTGFDHTTAELKDRQTYYQNADYLFDFATIWRIPDAGGYPVHQWEDPLSTPITVSSLFAGGDGSNGSPWQIATADQFYDILLAFKIDSNTITEEFILTSNITLTKPISPIGTNSNPFTGVFDGNDKTIANVEIENNGIDYSGLFGYLSNATIRDLTITTIGVAGANEVGVLAGWVSGGTITNVHIRGATGDGSDVVSATGGRIGGLAGRVTGSTTVISQSSVDNLTITATSYWCGGMVGGLVGAGIEKSYVGSGVSLSGSTETGGFVGVLSNSASSIVSDSYSHASVTSNGNGVGGFVGIMNTSSSVINSYSTGDVCSGNCSGSGDGPFVGDNSATVYNVFWDNQTSGWASGDGYGRSTTNMKNKYNYLTNADYSFDFASVWRIPDGGGYPVHQWEYPLASAVTVSSLFNGGDGSGGSPWQIDTADQFQNILIAYDVDPTVIDDAFELTSSITLTIPTASIGTNADKFTGTFEGNSNSISGVQILNSGYDYTGVFGYINGATIQNLTINTLGVAGTNWVGVIAGRSNAGTITNVHIRGATGDGSDTVSASGGRIGGIVGQMEGSTTVISQSSVDNLTITAASFWCGGMVGGLVGAGIERSYVGSGVSLSGSTETGGFVGVLSNSATSVVNNSYSHAAVTSTGNGVGGFVGIMNTSSVVSNSYSTGDVCSGSCAGTDDGPFVGSNSGGTLTSVFWDSDTSGWGAGSGTGVTTADFTNDGNANGIVDGLDAAGWSAGIWELDPMILGGGYPTLK